MKRIALLSLSALVFALTSCVPSLHPLYTAEDLTFDPKLVGKWSQADPSDSWEFTKAGKISYLLVYTDKEGKKGDFKANLFKLGEHRFLDLYPDDGALDRAEAPHLYKFHVQPMHTLARIDSIGPTLVMGFMSPDWIKDSLKKNTETICHENIRNRILLTAPTKDLQAFVKKHADGEGMFGRPMDLLRE